MLSYNITCVRLKYSEYIVQKIYDEHQVHQTFITSINYVTEEVGRSYATEVEIQKVVCINVTVPADTVIFVLFTNTQPVKCPHHLFPFNVFSLSHFSPTKIVH